MTVDLTLRDAGPETPCRWYWDAEIYTKEQVVKLRALESMEKVADGKATKIIIPSEIQSLAGLAASARVGWEAGDDVSS